MSNSSRCWKSPSQADEDDDQDEEIEGVATLHRSSEMHCQNTFAVMTVATEHHDEWRGEIATS
ncbi:MAG UNVERIFIED_CONTAM: hypothetical protein LVT10_20090 [Anaerolineae bacterium]